MTTPDKLVQMYLQRQGAMQQEFDEYMPTFRDIRNYLAPRTARFKGEKSINGARQDEYIINSSPRFAVRTLPSGLQAGVTSPMRPWFRLGLPDTELQEVAAVKLWLHDTEKKMREVFGRSNIYDRLKSNYGILGNYGTSALFLDEDDDDVVRAHDLLMGSFTVSTNAAGRVDTLYRDLSYTVVQMVEKFKERVPAIVKTQYDNGQYEIRHPICHIIEPNRNYRPGSALSQYKRYASVWLNPQATGAEAVLAYKGYDDLPHMCPRWEVVGEQTYGMGCGEFALGDSKQLQLMEKRKLQGIDKNVNPTMLADASMKNQRTSNVPGDTVYVNGLITGKPGYKPAYQVNPYLKELKEEGMRIEDRVNEAYYKNLFMMVSQIADQPNITATQINTMREEKLLMLGPVLERLNDELLDPMITRVFNIMQRKGMMQKPPKEIQGMPLKVEYISVLAQAQKAMGIGNIERFTTFVIGQLAPVSPDAMDKINIDEIIDEYADGVAVPPKLVRTQEEVAQLRAERQERIAQQEQMQQGMAATESAKTMSETNMTGDNALTRALEMAGG